MVQDRLNRDRAGLPTGSENLRCGSTLSRDGSSLLAVCEANGEQHSTGVAVTTDLAPERLVGVARRASGGTLSAADWTALLGPDVPADCTCR
ncbi:hypothetical protein [Micropruina sp.]|uniref:hypothetical protein n=1 Tax=Micropruina sp. TaxID=2737536 RepID=UPI0039E5D4D7